MIAALILSCAQGGALPRAIEESRAGRFCEAWEAAQAAPSELERAQASTYVRHHAGDLAGALRAAEEGLRATPGDEYLLATATELSLVLRQAAEAGDFVARWKRLGGAGAASPPEPVTRAEREVQDLIEEERRAEGASARARWISAAGALLALGCLALVARGSSQRAAQRST